MWQIFLNYHERMGILPLKKRVNRDKCNFATKQRMLGVFARSMRSFAIDEAASPLRARLPPSGTWRTVSSVFEFDQQVNLWQSLGHILSFGTKSHKLDLHEWDNQANSLNCSIRPGQHNEERGWEVDQRGDIRKRWSVLHEKSPHPLLNWQNVNEGAARGKWRYLAANPGLPGGRGAGGETAQLLKWETVLVLGVGA